MKKPKIFYMGRRINGQFDSFKCFVRRVVRLLVIGFVMCFVVWGIATYAYFEGASKTEVIFADMKLDKSSKSLEKKIESLKDELVDKLINGESKDHAPKDGKLFVTNDPHSAIAPDCQRIGGIRNVDCDSYGPAQYKLNTLILHYKMAYGKDISQVEALVISQDLVQVRELIKKVVIEHKGAIWAWSYAKQNADWFNEKITLIRELEEIK